MNFMKTIYITYLLLLALLFTSCCSDQPPKDEILPVTMGVETAPEPNDNTNTEKSSEEIIKEAVEASIETTKDVIKNLKKNDSIRFANREDVYAYRLGLPIRDEDEVFELYKTLYEIENIYVVKQSRKDYYLVYYNGNSEKQLNDSLEVFKATLPDQIRNEIVVLNLMELCTKSKQKLMRGEKLTKRREEAEIPCLICDK